MKQGEVTISVEEFEKLNDAYKKQKAVIFNIETIDKALKDQLIAKQSEVDSLERDHRYEIYKYDAVLRINKDLERRYTELSDKKWYHLLFKKKAK